MVTFISVRVGGWVSCCGPIELYVSRLSLCVMQDLKDLMRKAGDVTYADAHKDRRNEGYVSMLEIKKVNVDCEATGPPGTKILLAAV